jgi:hypothetical protein
VRAYQLADGLWTADIRYGVKCSDGSPVMDDIHSEWPLPDQPANSIPRLTGTQRDLYAEPCPGTSEASIVMERIGD